MTIMKPKNKKNDLFKKKKNTIISIVYIMVFCVFLKEPVANHHDV